MKRAFIASAVAVATTIIGTQAWAQGRGGCQGGGGTSTGTAASTSGIASLLSGTGGGLSPATTAADINSLRAAAMRQAYVQMMQQAYLQQMQAQVLRQQLAAANKAEQKERRLAYWRQRREIELARRESRSPNLAGQAKLADFAAVTRQP